MNKILYTIILICAIIMFHSPAKASELISDEQLAVCLANSTYGIYDRLIINYQSKGETKRSKEEAVVMADEFFVEWAAEFRAYGDDETVIEYFTRHSC